MAVTTARQAQTVRGGDIGVHRVVDTVVDERAGVAAQRERILAAVPDEHGNVIVMMQERIRAVQLVSYALTVPKSSGIILRADGHTACMESSIALAYSCQMYS